MKYYKLSVGELLKSLNTTKDGLNSEEARLRLELDGKNNLIGTKKESIVIKFLKEFKDLMIIILIIAAIFSFSFAYMNDESYIESIAIVAVVILNAVMGLTQQLKADKAMKVLKQLQNTKTKVKRDGEICLLNSENLVVGDLIFLEAGDIIPADARIISESSLKCDESTLTGESSQVLKSVDKLNKDEPLVNRSNMIYSGTYISYGKCSALVTNIGMNTEVGLIAKSLNEQKQEITPLEEKIKQISHFLSAIITIIIVVMLLVGLSKGMDLKNIIILSISLAVAAIPEGLPTVITIILALGVSNMAKKKTVVKKLSSVETLGSTEVICTDKTGTITENKLTVKKIFADGKILKRIENVNNVLTEIIILNNDAFKTKEEYIGDPVDVALYQLLENGSFNIEIIREQNPIIGELPFDSKRKLRTTIHQSGKEIKVFIKGSFDNIIKYSNKIYENGKVIKLSENKKESLKKIESALCKEAYRTLAFAYKKTNNNYKLNQELEQDLIFVGMVGMIDPPRSDVKAAIALCKKAHIKPIMITGDSLDTAMAIGKEIGIIKSETEAITGMELDKLSKDELKEKVKDYSVYARVSPTNKISIVNAWKENNVIVAMTGDGINDAPALKAANIGIGMGINGTEVSKEASDIILLDDSFSTIITAVKEGRRIFDNLRNVLVYLLTGNIAEIIIVFVGMLFGVPIFLPIQLLYINLITDSIPAVALAFEEASPDIMNRKVRKKGKALFTRFLIAKILYSAIFKSLFILVIFYVNAIAQGIESSITMSFLSLILLEILYAYSCRNIKEKITDKTFFENKYLNRGIFVLIIIQLIVFLTPVKHVFGITSLNFYQVAYCVFMVIAAFFIEELSKNIITSKFED